MLLLVLYVLREFHEMRRLGRSYLRSLWNYWDWAAVSLVIAAAVCRYQQFRGMRAVELHLKATRGSFANFHAVAVYAASELGLTALSALMIYIKVHHLPHPNPDPSPSPNLALAPPPRSTSQALHLPHRPSTSWPACLASTLCSTPSRELASSSHPSPSASRSFSAASPQPSPLHSARKHTRGTP